MKPIILVLVSISLASALTCPSYSCASDDVVLSDTACKLFDQANNRFHLKPCESEELSHCPHEEPKYVAFYEPENETQCVKKPLMYLPRFPGEVCTQASDCTTGICMDQVCMGHLINEHCTSHSQCNPGLYCDDEVCTPLKSLGESCSEEAECNYQAGCLDGVCTKYYSLQVGDVVKECSDFNTSDYCETGSCDYDGCLNFNFICTKPFKSEGRTPKQCSSDSDCKLSNGEDTIDGHCACGYNEDGAAFCHLHMGDKLGQDLLNKSKKLVEAGLTSVCNTSRRWHYMCLQKINDPLAQNVIDSGFIFNNFPGLQDNDKCVEQTIWQEREDLNGSQAVTAALALLLALVI